MDQRVQLIQNILQKNIAAQLEIFQQRKNTKSAQLKEKCYVRSEKEVDRFVSCIDDGTNRIKELDEDLKLQLQFSARIAHDCLRRGSSVEKCSVQATKFGKKMIEYALKQIQKI